MAKIRKIALARIDSEEGLKEGVVSFYLAPHSLSDTGAEFNLRPEEVKVVLSKMNVPLHSGEIMRKLRNETLRRNSLEKYGVESPNQAQCVKDRKREVYIEKYGVESPVRLPKAIENRQRAMSDRGEEIKTKREQTFLKKYGCKEAISSPQVREKIRKTCRERYGVDNPFSCPQIQQKQRETLRERYGVDHVSRIPEGKEKSRKTCLERYGKEWYTQTEESKNRHREKSGQRVQKMREQFREKYGVDWITQDPDYIKRCQETKRKNKSFNASKPEQIVKSTLEEIFGKNDVAYQYSDDRYPFECDFYIKSKDMFIECNFHWTHGFHPFDESNPEDIATRNKWREKGTKFYLKALEVWTIRDVAKRETAERNKLNYVSLYTQKDYEEFIAKYEHNG